MKKSDFIIPELQPNLKVGDKVVFVDGSYTLSLVDGEMKHTLLGLSDDVFTIVAVNVSLPSDHDNHDDILLSSNNCIVYLEKDESYHFCSKLNIRSLRGLLDTGYQLKSGSHIYP